MKVRNVPLDVAGSTRGARPESDAREQFAIALARRQLEIQRSTLEPPQKPTDDLSAVLLAVSGELGAAGRGVASRAAIGGLLERFERDHPWIVEYDEQTEAEFAKRLGVSFHEIDRSLREHAVPDRSATLTAAWVFGPQLYVAHVGDDQVFRLRGEQFEKLTTDHTVACELADKGLLDSSDTRMDTLGDVLWNALGSSGPRAEPAISRFSLEPGDRFVICTRALVDDLGESAIEEALLSEPNADGACAALSSRDGSDRADSNKAENGSAFVVLHVMLVARERMPIDDTAGREAAVTAERPDVASPLPAGEARARPRPAPALAS